MHTTGNGVASIGDPKVSTDHIMIWEEPIEYSHKPRSLAYLRDNSDKFSLLAIYIITQGIPEDTKVYYFQSEKIISSIYAPTHFLEFRKFGKQRKVHSRTITLSLS